VGTHVETTAPVSSFFLFFLDTAAISNRVCFITIRWATTRLCHAFPHVAVFCSVDVYRRVKDARQGAFRPTLLETDDDDLVSMVKRCWAEDAGDRPEFSTIRGLIKRINRCVVRTTAAVLVSRAEAVVRSLTNMAAADSNGYLKSNYVLNINNRRTKRYTYSYIHVRTFTKTEPVFKQSHNAAMFVGEASRRLQRLLLF